jgi:DNA-binding response OmpR family regulator
MARILVADDNPQIAKLVALKLSMSGHEVTVVGDGLEAVGAFERSVPELCILDVMMPGISGLQVLKTLRQKPEFDKIPIVILTAIGEEKHVVQALRDGADEYVTKPFSPAELLARVERLLAA